MSSAFGEEKFETSTGTPSGLDKVIEVKLIVSRVARWLPFPCKCLAQAMVAQRLLVKSNLGSTLYLGVAKDEKNKLKAHAWLRCGDIVVTGARVKDEFTVVSTFAKEVAHVAKQ